MKTIDMTPTWSEILPTLLLLLREGKAEGKTTAQEELAKMARVADAYVKEHKLGRKA
jgi:hypothetical protein